MTVDFFSPGANPLIDTPLYTFHTTATKVESKAEYKVAGVPPGTYDVLVDSEHTLMNLKRDVVIAGSEVMVDLGTLLEGNANDHDVVNILDFTLQASTFLKTSPITVPEGEQG